MATSSASTLALVAVLALACDSGARGRDAARRESAPNVRTWTRVTVIDPPDDAPEALGRVAGMAVDDSGRVIVYDAMPPRILRFHPNGAFDRIVAREGSGPGEIRFAALGLFHDTLVVHDATLKRVTVFGPDGTVVRTFGGPCCAFESETPVDRHGRIWLRARLAAGREGWIRVTLRGDVADSVVDHSAVDLASTWPLDERRADVAGYSVSGMRISIPLTPARWSVPRWDGALLEGSTASTRFAIVAASGDTLRVLAARDRDTPVTPAQRESVATAALAVPARLLRVPPSTLASRVALSRIPSRWPAWTAVRTDRRDRIWIARPPGDSVGLFCDGFDATGAPIARQRAVHPRLFDDAVFGRDHVAIRTTDANDRPVIEVYRIPR